MKRLLDRFTQSGTGRKGEEAAEVKADDEGYFATQFMERPETTRASSAWTARGLDLQIDDDGCGAAADPATRGSGQGLRGAAERAALFGGTLESGPRVGAGYRVSAHLPYSAV